MTDNKKNRRTPNRGQSSVRRPADRAQMPENIVAGRNPVMEAIRAGRTIDKIYVADGENEGSVIKLLAMASDAGIPIVRAGRSKLTDICGTSSHQGVAAFTTPFEYCEPQDILEYARMRGEDPFVVVLDGVSDPHNLGAVIRTADACGVHGLILPKRGSCSLTPAVYTAAAGACEYAKIARVVNIARTVEFLKDNGVWVYAADGSASESVYDIDLKGPAAIVLGDEGSGISRLVRDRCDRLLRIPMRGRITSLNVSVAGAVMMYEVLRQRG